MSSDEKIGFQMSNNFYFTSRMTQIRIFTKSKQMSLSLSVCLCCGIFFFVFSFRLVNHNLGQKYTDDLIHETMDPSNGDPSKRTAWKHQLLIESFVESFSKTLIWWLSACCPLFIIRFQHKVTSKLIQFENLISNSILSNHNILSTF